MKPTIHPKNPCFSSGPCTKRPGWSLQTLGTAALGRSHRAKIGKTKLAAVIEKSKTVLGMPDDWRLGIVPASDTGAIEMALWNLLGPRGVDVFAWESFGATWATDCKKQLKLKDLNVYTAPYGQLPDLRAYAPTRDCVFTWNGTTSGVRVPHADWISDTREGLVICDATSAVFAMDIPWNKLDVVTWSWQKVLGGEGAHGMIALSTRAVKRLQTYTPGWPIPKIFQLAKPQKDGNGAAVIEGIFAGETINTPSMLCVEDALDGLDWAARVGNMAGLVARSEANLAALTQWVDTTPWIDFLAGNKATRSCTSMCLKIVEPAYEQLAPDAQAEIAKKLAGLLEKEGVAYDIGAYRDAPPGLRIWGGATVETADIIALTPWLDWAWSEVSASLNKAA